MAATTKKKTATKTTETASEVVSDEVDTVVQNEEKTAQSAVSEAGNVSTEQMMAMLKQMQEMQAQIASLTSQLSEAKQNENKISKAIDATTEVTNSSNSGENSFSEKADKLLEILTNKKSDKEVTIVHNREMIGGLTTSIKLSNMQIDFHRLGEQRTISWQQFEELVSKYRNFFDKEIILLGSEYEDLAEKYSVKCAPVESSRILTHSILEKLGKMSVEQLGQVYAGLSKEDKKFFCSYWIGKCYEKDEDFYNRYKIEYLNALTKKGIFQNVLVSMNNDKDVVHDVVETEDIF